MSTPVLHSRASKLLAVAAILILASTRMQAATGTCSGQSLTLPFTDVPGSNIFFCSIAQAFFTGLTNGTSATSYSPAANVTRDQMATFITRTQDSALKRGSRRAAAGQWWNPKDVGFLNTTVVGSEPGYSCFDGEDIWVPNLVSGTVTRVHASDGLRMSDELPACRNRTAAVTHRQAGSSSDIRRTTNWPVLFNPPAGDLLVFIITSVLIPIGIDQH